MTNQFYTIHYAALKKQIKKDFGTPCPDFEIGCVVCRAYWALSLLDNLRMSEMIEYFCVNDEHRVGCSHKLKKAKGTIIIKKRLSNKKAVIKFGNS